MTRENKLALIIGFSLILVVAILLADHLSPAQRSEMDALDSMFADGPQIALPSANDSEQTSGDGDSNQGPINIFQRTTPVVQPDQLDRSGSFTSRWEEETLIPVDERLLDRNRPIEMGQPLPGANDNDPRRSASGTRMHVVARDETLYGIAKYYYGDGSLAEALAKVNSDRVLASGAIRTGATLFIPTREVLIGRGEPPTANERSIGSSETTQYRTYTIAENDRLWDIAKQFLGKGSRWQEIADLNRDVIKNPDVLPMGKTIRIPDR